ncbi:amidase [Paraburkholderia bannensis]|uniref:amidase n=1 Tax=Paraburkholderia bannensis TaxID=765414 RepID=UPI002ABE9B99|nr:amidase [Paraburkholderia bannensis]
MHELLDLSATALAELYRSRRVTPSDYAEVLLEHIARWEPHARAFYLFDPDNVRAQAKASTKRWASGEQLSDVDGVPVTIKENITTEGDPAPQGSVVGPKTPANADAPVAARLRDAGALFLGKTTMPDYGMLSSGISSLHGITRNPWQLESNTGGSSSGAGAAAAAGYGPLHVGTDIGGSIRLPSGWCGVVGLKPTYGRVPVYPYFTGRCAGPMTRTVDDAALLMRYIAQPDSRDATSPPAESIDWTISAANVSGLRIGLALDAGCGTEPDTEILAAVERAAEQFARRGAKIVRLKPVLNRTMLDGLDGFWRARLWNDLKELSDADLSRVLPYIVEWARQGKKLSGTDVIDGVNAIFDMKASTARAFDSVDAILSPTSPVTAFPAEWASPTNNPDSPFEHITFTVPWNMGGQPALSINCGFARNGMPIGLQIIAPRFADQQLLGLAKAYENWRGPTLTWPCPPDLAGSN